MKHMMSGHAYSATKPVMEVMMLTELDESTADPLFDFHMHKMSRNACSSPFLSSISFFPEFHVLHAPMHDQSADSCQSAGHRGHLVKSRRTMQAMLAALGEDFREQQARLLQADASVAEMASNAGEMQAMLSWLTTAHAEESAARQAFEHQVLILPGQSYRRLIPDAELRTETIDAHEMMYVRQLVLGSEWWTLVNGHHDSIPVYVLNWPCGQGMQDAVQSLEVHWLGCMVHRVCWAW